jgi:hypothetical protein
VRSQEDLARAIAKTKGEQSEAAKALRELDARRSSGEEVVIFPLRGRWLVGPPAEVEGEVATTVAEGIRQRSKPQQGQGEDVPEALRALRAAAKRGNEDPRG